MKLGARIGFSLFSFQIGYVQFTCMWRWLPSVSRSFLLRNNGRLCNSSSTFHFNWKCWAFCGFYGTQSLDHYWPAFWPSTIGFKRALNDKVGKPISWYVLRMTLFGITFFKKYLILYLPGSKLIWRFSSDYQLGNDWMGLEGRNAFPKSKLAQWLYERDFQTTPIII